MKGCVNSPRHQLGFEILGYPPYSSDFAPMGLGKLRGMRFEDASELCMYTQFHHTPVTGLVISMLIGYRDMGNPLEFVVITLK